MAKFAVWAGVIAISCLAGCGPSSFLTQAQDICVKYSTPDARAECERRYQQTQKAWQQEQEKEKRQAQRPDAEGGNPPDTLCFVRKSSGERVCPN